jgi:LysR family transcriptional regulator, flagellar master operon regulator
MIDVEVARTFLAVIETGTFQGAAGKVNVTQSTVSARIRTLEERLGVKVFTRSKSGAELTANGRHFERYARAIVRGWEQGRYQAGLPERFDELLVVGGQYNLWARLLSNWLNEMRAALPSVAFRAEAGSPLHLSQLLSEGLVDIAVLHHPRFRPDIDVELLMEDELILVTADPEGAFEDRYVFVDWGEAFRDMHAQKLPELMEPRTTVSLGFFGAPFLISSGTAGYMPRRLVQPHIDEGHLFETSSTPLFSYPVYAAHHVDRMSPAVETALQLLRTQARLADQGELPAPFWNSRFR